MLIGLGQTAHRSRGAIWILGVARAAVVGVVVFFSGQVGALGVDGAERLADYSFVLWVVVTGLVCTLKRE